MKRISRRIIGATVIVSFLSMLLVVNVSTAQGFEVQPSPASTTCAVELTSAEMGQVYGTGIVSWIDGGCGILGVYSVFAAINPVAGAFCAGWGIGRWIDSL